MSDRIGLAINRNGDDASWMTQGSCNDYIDVADLWHPETNQRNRAAQDAADAIYICSTCPVREPCATYAIDNRELHGIWGGLTVEQRKRMWARRVSDDVARPRPTHEHR